MPVAKLSSSDATSVMKSDDGNDSLDTFIRQAIGKEPLISFSRTGDTPLQWIQLLHSLDQPDVPGWPLLAPLKVQMQKCEKCSREFCSPINYRRHIRMHRRSLNVDKESHKNRDLLGAFWDKLSLEEAKEVVSFEDVSLKEVPGSSVIKALAASLRKPGVWTLPQVYVKAGSILLGIVQARSSRLPISSDELFSILDDASEKTFLCAGTAESVQNFVIEGEAERALELKNLVASASLLFEQKLVKAWLANKDAEALRCQKLLVEEEEAAQRRQAQLLERKKQKRLRQKELKAKEQSSDDIVDGSADSGDTSAESVDEPVSAEISIPQVPSDNDPVTLADLSEGLDQVQFPSTEDNVDAEAQFDFSIDHAYIDSFQNVESRIELVNGRRQFTINRWQVAKPHGSGRNVLHGSQNGQAFKLEPIQKQGYVKERGTMAGVGKIWTRKSEEAVDDENSRPNLERVATDQIDRSNCELLIGSISVPVRDDSTAEPQRDSRGVQTSCSARHAIAKKYTVPEKSCKSEAVHSGTNQPVAKLWRPVSQSETRAPLPVQRGTQDSEESATLGKVDDQAIGSELRMQSSQDSEESVTLGKVDDQAISGEIRTESCGADTDDIISKKHCPKGNEKSEGMFFSSVAAKAFLAERWKEAISSDHVKLVLSPYEREPPVNPDRQNGGSVIAPSSGINERSNLIDPQNQLTDVGAPLYIVANGHVKAKFRTKMKYIRKQKNVT